MQCGNVQTWTKRNTACAKCFVGQFITYIEGVATRHFHSVVPLRVYMAIDAYIGMCSRITVTGRSRMPE